MRDAISALLFLAIALYGFGRPAIGEDLIRKQYRPVVKREVIDGRVFSTTIMEEVKQTKVPISTRTKRLPEPNKWDPNQSPSGRDAIQVRDDGCSHRLLVGSDTLFAFDQHTLTADAEKTLHVLGPMLKAYGVHPVTVEGHTDSIGTDEYNMDLSQRRAKTVRDWLVDHNFIAADAVKTSGFGKSRPVAPNTYTDGTDFPQGRQKNRRVEVIINTCL